MDFTDLNPAIFFPKLLEEDFADLPDDFLIAGFFILAIQYMDPYFCPTFFFDSKDFCCLLRRFSNSSANAKYASEPTEVGS